MCDGKLEDSVNDAKIIGTLQASAPQLKAYAVYARAIFLSFTSAGFTEDQALQLTKYRLRIRNG